MTIAHSTLTGSDLHAPKAHATSHEPGGSDALAVDAAAGTGSLRSLGTTASKAAAGNHTVPAFVGSGGGHAAGHVPDPGASAGTTRYMCEDGTWSVPPGGGGGSFGPDTPIQMTVQNESGGPLPKGASVTITSGATGAHPAVIDFRDSDPGGRDHILGVLAEAIADTATGLCTVRGPLAGIDTSGFSLGNVIYAGSPAGPTGWVAGFPATPYSRQLGIITVVDATVGELYVLPEEASVFDHGHTGPGDGGALGPFVVTEQIPAGNPSAGTQFLFISPADHKLYRRTSAGVDTLIG